MGIIEKGSHGVALEIRGKIGNSLDFGEKIYGRCRYGGEEPILGPSQYGWAGFGEDRFGNASSRWGIYRVRRTRDGFLLLGQKETGKQVVQKDNWHYPSNPQTVPQQANRQKYADGVAAWQVLTGSEKDVYNERAKYKQFSGYNLFLKEYLLSH